MKALDRQVGGKHYKDHAIQPVEFYFHNHLGGCEASIIKYLARWRRKGGVEDLRKAVHYLELLQEMEESLPAWRRWLLRALAWLKPQPLATEDYIRANGMTAFDQIMVGMLVHWRRYGPNTLVFIRENIQAVILQTVQD